LQGDVVFVSETRNIQMPCIWCCGPLTNDRVVYGVSVASKKWFLRFTPFWPTITNYVPGAFIDSAGQLFKVKRLVGWKPQPSWLTPGFGGVMFNLRRIFVKFDIEVEDPVQLSFDEMKAEIIKITESDFVRPMKRPTKRISRVLEKFQDAKSCRDLVDFLKWYISSDAGKIGDTPL
jgi:hypothetical protein